MYKVELPANQEPNKIYNMHDEFLPPTKEELEKIIKDLEAQLEDDAYQEDWVKIHDELKT